MAYSLNPFTGRFDETLDIPVSVTEGGTGTSTAFTLGSVVFAGAAGVYTQNNSKFFWDDSAFQLKLGGGATLKLTGGTTTGQGNIQMGATASGSYDTNLTYVENNNMTMGMLCSSTPAFLASNGPYVALRGNSYAAIANQRGLLSIGAGNPATPVGYDGAILFQTGANVNRIVVLPNGYVGFGMDNPGNKVHIFESGNVNTTFCIENQNAGSSAIPYTQYRSNAGGHGVGAGSIASPYLGGLFMYTAGNYPTTFWNNGVEVMRMLGNGNIGVNSPSAVSHFTVDNSRDTSTSIFHAIGVTASGKASYYAEGTTNGAFNAAAFQNTNNGSSAYNIVRFLNDTSQAGFFLNSSTRTTDGGAGGFSFYNDAGGVSFRGSFVRFGTSALPEILYVASTARIGINQPAPTAQLHISAGSATANTAPIKLTSGPLNATAEVGTIEFLTDAFYATITTGAARKTIAFIDSNITGTAAGTTGVTPAANGTYANPTSITIVKGIITNIS